MDIFDNICPHCKKTITLEELIKNIIIWNKKYGKFENKIDYTIFEKNGNKIFYKI